MGTDLSLHGTRLDRTSMVYSLSWSTEVFSEELKVCLFCSWVVYCGVVGNGGTLFVRALAGGFGIKSYSLLEMRFHLFYLLLHFDSEVSVLPSCLLHLAHILLQGVDVFFAFSKFQLKKLVFLFR